MNLPKSDKDISRDTSRHEARVIGPVLPPGFSKPADDSSSDSEENSHSISETSEERIIGPTTPTGRTKHGDTTSESSDEESYGPPIPSNTKKNSNNNSLKTQPSVIGPSIPPSIKQNISQENAENSSSSSAVEPDMYGPCLPPTMQTKEKVMGPSLPPGLKLHQVQRTPEDDDSDDEIIGPLQSDADYDKSLQYQYAMRAAMLKERDREKDNGKPSREEWMTELPPEMSKNFGLGARTFSRKKGSGSGGDRSGWTETPADRERKKMGLLEPVKVTPDDEMERKANRRYDKMMAKAVEEYNKDTRGESLMDLHKKKLKRKAEEEKSQVKERRPFDRDLDLKANKIDALTREKMIQRASDLGSKFGHGSSQFL